ncbi:hypothetical protein Glove_259g12 [Diversispora epigaea]|uniref:Uncharacterized protein n=1 Tax=Diversispora epigaea TaxID=1348612 RepID=A0A397I6X2_9GLOM|nr:hypothetical protein Glove_259g12 [Diversispora epigaea]
MGALISPFTTDVIQSHYFTYFMVCTKPNYGNYGGDQRVSMMTPSSLFLHGEQLLKKCKYHKAAEKFIRVGTAFTPKSGKLHVYEKSSLAFDKKAMTDLTSSYLSAFDTLEQVIPPSLTLFHFAPLSLNDGDRINDASTELISLNDLKKSYTLAMARLELDEIYWKKTVTSIKSYDVVELCSYAQFRWLNY